MASAQELTELLNKLSAYARAVAWAQTVQNHSSTIQRIFQRLKLFGPQYILSAGLHYLTVAFPRLGRRTIQSSTFWGKPIFIELRAAESFRLLFRGAPGSEPEVRLTRFLLQRLTANDVFYDVGANIGYYSMLAAEIGAEVHAFEPVPTTFRLLRDNVAAYGKQVFANCIALSDTDGEITMYLPPDWYLTSTLVKETLDKVANTITVRTTQLDMYAQQNHAPTVIKIDVEGAEKLVLAGSSTVIENHHPIIVVEICPGQRGIDLSVPAAQFLLDRGYRMHQIDPTGALKPVSTSPSDYIVNYHGEFDNVVFVHPA
jgi:FkbM family methyltransferase